MILLFEVVLESAEPLFEEGANVQWKLRILQRV